MRSRARGRAAAIAVGAWAACPIAADASWTHLGMTGESIRQLSANGEYVFAITQDGGFFDRSLWRVRIDGEESAEQVLDPLGASPWVVACHPLAPDTVYVGLSGSYPLAGPLLMRSVDGGATFHGFTEGLCNPEVGVRHLLASAESPSQLTVGGDDVIYTGLSSGGPWEPIAQAGPEGCPCGAACVAMIGLGAGTNDRDVFWLVNDTLCFGIAVYGTRDGGENWTLDHEKCEDLFCTVAVDHENAERAYMIRSGERLRTVDGGTTWDPLPGPPSCSFFVVDPLDAAMLYQAGAGPSVHWSGSHGVLWNEVDMTGLPPHAVGGFTASAVTQGQLFLGFAGTAGVYTTQVNVAPVSVETSPEPPRITQLVASPNPFTRGTTIRSSGVPRVGLVPIHVFDSAGRLVRVLAGGGARSWFWDGASQDRTPVRPGVYFARLGEEAGAAVRLVKLR